MNIRGKKVLLRAIEREDLELLHTWSNDPDIWHMLGGWHFPINKNDQEKWFLNLSTNSLNQRFAIDVPEFGIIGTVSLVEIDWKNKHAFHGMLLGNIKQRGAGFGTDTIMAVMRYAFEELGLERLDGSIIEYNEISLNVYCKKCGWKEEGRQRNWYFRKNRFWDKILVGITRKDYFDLIKQNNYWEV